MQHRIIFTKTGLNKQISPFIYLFFNAAAFDTHTHAIVALVGPGRGGRQTQ